MKDLVDFLDVEPLLRFSLPATQHDVVNLLGTNSRPLQDSALGDALDNLKQRTGRVNLTQQGSKNVLSRSLKGPGLKDSATGTAKLQKMLWI